MKTKLRMLRQRWLLVPSLILILVLLTVFTSFAATRIAATAPAKSGEQVSQNQYAAIDWSNLSEGYVSVAYTAGGNKGIKVQVIKDGCTTYTYNLNNTGTPEVFPITEGDGTYTLKVYRNTTGNRYTTVLTASADVTLRNEFLPFLYPNQYVNYTQDSETAKKAAALTYGITAPMEELKAIYRYVVNSFTYDYQLAATVKSGYLPNVDKVLESKKGICFDYAALMTAMLRSQGIPCKLVIGYADTAYHAWINVYIEGTGWISNAIYFDGQNWTLLDPTYASTSHSSPSVLKFIANTNNYTQKYAY